MDEVGVIEEGRGIEFERGSASGVMKEKDPQNKGNGNKRQHATLA